MVRHFIFAVVTVCVLGCINAESSKQQLLANPIRKVVSMLQDMQKTVESEGEKEKELFEKFMCYCNNGAGSLDASIQTAAAAIESLTGRIETEKAQKSQSEQEVVQHKTDRSEAEKTIKESTAMRGKEANEFAATSGELKANLEAMTGALAALRKGLGASLLQTKAGQTLRNIIEHSPAVSEGERSTLVSFLENGESSGETGSTDQIIGIVDQMKDEMAADLKETTSSEEEAKAGFATLMSSKEQEIAAAGKAVEEKTGRIGELAVSAVQAEADLKDTQEAMEEDTKFKANLAAQCATKSKEWDARQKLRAEEVEAISETIEMLNGDDALELFKKTLPSAAAFVQVAVTTRSQQRRASSILRSLMVRDSKHKVNLHMMLMALKSGGGFDKVVSMIDNMIATLEKEQADDDKKRDWCTDEIHTVEQEVKALEGEVSDVSADIEEKEDQLDTVKSEIAALQKSNTDMDKSVAQATEQRQDEHAEYASTSASNQAALELIAMAKNRMNKFYAPSQYKAPPTTTVSDSPYGFIQLSSRADPGPAPETFGEYKKSESSGGVMAMMDQMIKDVEMDIQEAKHDEADAQKDYEEEMKDAAEKRESDSKLIVEKEGSKADTMTRLQNARELRATKREQFGITKDKEQSIHVDCDYLLKNYEDTKAKRATERDGLQQSKAVLAGASPA
jgi:predicted  nucleic acid-binding Zn-ribbon protein